MLERSHLVVQIVDARNPLRFRCEDLEDYIRDVEGSEGESGTGKGKRRSLLLINKADLLTAQQRYVYSCIVCFVPDDCILAAFGQIILTHKEFAMPFSPQLMQQLCNKHEEMLLNTPLYNRRVSKAMRTPMENPPMARKCRTTEMKREKPSRKNLH